MTRRMTPLRALAWVIALVVAIALPQLLGASDVNRLGEVMYIAVAALGLWATGQETLAIVLAAVALVSGILNYLWGDA